MNIDIGKFRFTYKAKCEATVLPMSHYILKIKFRLELKGGVAAHRCVQHLETVLKQRRDSLSVHSTLHQMNITILNTSLEIR